MNLIPETLPSRRNSELGDTRAVYSRFSGRKILYVVNDPGFFLSHRQVFADEASAAGFEVHVAGPDDYGWEDVVAAGFPYHHVDIFKWGRNPIQELRSIASLYYLYTQLKPDVVHHSTIKPVLYGGIAARIAKVPACVHTMSGLGHIFTSKRSRLRFLKPLVLRLFRASMSFSCCRLIVQNSDDQAVFIKSGCIPSQNIRVIKGSGIDLEKFQPSSEPAEGRPLVILPARLLWDKGVAEFVDAARQLLDAGVPARFALVGKALPGNPSGISSKQLREWIRGGLIEWWGHQHSMASVYQRASIVCLPSYREGLPKVLLEAAACGKPIVTTDTSGCREMVRHGYNGYLVPIRNVTTLAAALKTLLTDPELQETMGMASREHVQSGPYAVDWVVAETMAIYEELLALNAPRSMQEVPSATL
jgi:glycosyltransferase involved in cell wall biosynthesis